MTTPASPLRLDRWLDRLPISRCWTIALIGIALSLLMLAAIYVDGVVDRLLTAGYWRFVLEGSALIVYVLAVSQPLQNTRAWVATGLRPIVPLDDDAYQSLIDEASQSNVRGELTGLGLGMLFTISLSASGFTPLEDAFWTTVLLVPFALLMWGLIGWLTYGAVSVIGFTSTLLRQPLDFDIFDPSPFEPIGRQSLALSLTFIGGILISFIFSLRPDVLVDVRVWIIYTCLTVVTLLVFFLNMRSTHSLMSRAKAQARVRIEHHMATAFHRMDTLAAEAENVESVAVQINAWATYRQEIKLVRTWPYNTEMLRTLFLTILTPVFIGLARVVAMLLAQGSLVRPPFLGQ
jgi:hypothetical protein